MAALHTTPTNGFYGWVAKNPQADNRYTCVATPTHLVFGHGLNGQFKKIQAAVAWGDNDALLSIRGVTVHDRREVTSLRYVPDEQRLYVYEGDKRKWHPMWPEIFSALDGVLPNANVQAEDYSSASIKGDRYFVAVMPYIFLAIHWMANNWDLSNVRRGRFLAELVGDIPAATFYPAMVLLSVGLAVHAYKQNQTPSQSFTIDFTAVTAAAPQSWPVAQQQRPAA